MIPLLLTAFGGYMIGSSVSTRFAKGGLLKDISIKEFGDDVVFRIGRRAIAVINKTTVMDALDYEPYPKDKNRRKIWRKRQKNYNLEYPKKERFIKKNNLDLKKEVYYLDHIEVNPKYRGQGLASRLMKAVLAWSKASDLEYIFLYRVAYDPWETALSDTELKKFYKRYGFVDVGGGTMAKKL